jgi:hypothetical protein
MQKAYGGLVAFESNVAQIPFDRSRMEQKSLTKHALLSTTVIFDSTMAAQHDDGDNDDDDPVHAMAPFLEERLPALGLDYETYGPYILPLLTTNDKDDYDGVTSSDNEADEEWNTVLELLQASSSLEASAADDMMLWQTFRSDIETAWRTCRIDQQQKRAAQQSRQALAAQEQMEHDRQLALLAKERQETSEQSRNNKVDDEAKRRLVEQYGYEASDDDEEQQPGAAGGEPVVANNREVAQQLEQAKTKAMREHKVQPTKQEEQLKTKEAKKTKEMLKEERRKRAVKGERRR